MICKWFADEADVLCPVRGGLVRVLGRGLPLTRVLVLKSDVLKSDSPAAGGGSGVDLDWEGVGLHIWPLVLSMFSSWSNSWCTLASSGAGFITGGAVSGVDRLILSASLSCSDLWSRLWAGLVMGKAVSKFLDRVLGLPKVVCWLLGASCASCWAICLVSIGAVYSLLILAGGLVLDAFHVHRSV